MPSSKIYSDFAPEIVWIRDTVASDINELPASARTEASHYVTKRLRILSGTEGIRLDPALGRPVPYAAFWFADAFNLRRPEFVRHMGLCLVYNSLTTTLKDDLKDGRVKEPATLERLRRFWSAKYDGIMKSAFPPSSSFWRTASLARDEWRRYDEWNASFDQTSRFDPYSDRFLGESSRYFVAVVYPALAGIAVQADASREVPKIGRFLRRFSAGWRIFDDLMDWNEDIDASKFNRSSILYYVMKRVPSGTALGRDIVMGSFLSQEFVEDTYGAILRNLRKARDVVRVFGNNYLSKFMEEQLDFHSRRRDTLLRSSRSFFSALKGSLTKSRVRKAGAA